MQIITFADETAAGFHEPHFLAHFVVDSVVFGKIVDT